MPLPEAHTCLWKEEPLKINDPGLQGAIKSKLQQCLMLENKQRWITGSSKSQRCFMLYLPAN